MPSDAKRGRREPAAARATAGWSAAPQRFPPGRFAIIEPIGLNVHDWSRPRNGQSRMFDQDFLEWFTRVHPTSVAIVHGSLCLWVLGSALATDPSPVRVAGLFILGAVLWSLIEYLIHRFSFHHTPRSRTGMFWAYLSHGVHHAFPEDDRRWLVPPIVSVPVAALFYLVIRAVTGSLAAPLFAGGLLGYLTYDLGHYTIHRGSSRFGFINGLRRRHLQHHYQTPDRWFGVSSPLWDYIFRTNR
jgi:sterol desaturase/sphingolipid hydroxylase (fatty acid hydroxylase superfamily)